MIRTDSRQSRSCSFGRFEAFQIVVIVCKGGEVAGGGRVLANELWNVGSGRCLEASIGRGSLLEGVWKSRSECHGSPVALTAAGDGGSE
jgi:hypothetical protein